MMAKLITISVLILSVFTALYLFRSDNFEPESIKGKRVLVTGASSGIGEELAYKYAQLGAKLVITARSAELLENVAEKCRKLGANEVKTVVANLSIAADREKLAVKTQLTLGGLDFLLLNHAAILYGWWEATPEDMMLTKDLLNIGFLSYVHLTSLFMKSLEHSHGHIGVTSSTLRRYAPAGLTHSNAVKHALQGFYSSLRQELRSRKTGVSVTIAVFGLIDIEQIKAMYSGNVSNSELLFKETNMGEAVEAYIQAVSSRAYEFVYPRTYKVIWTIYRIVPKYFEDFVHWLNERMINR